MSIQPQLSETASAQALRSVLTFWSLAFTVLWIAFTARMAVGDARAAAAIVFELVVALLAGQWVGRRIWAMWEGSLRKQVSRVAVLVIGTALGLALLDFTLARLRIGEPVSFDPRLVDQIGRPFIVYLWMFAMLVLGLRFAIVQLRNRRQGIELAEARAAAAQAQLAMLRYQLNPHFLFNTLNAISTLVVTGRSAAAEEMLARLSSFLRASLVSEPGDFVTLDDELAVIQEYLEIESVRFGDRLRVDFGIGAQTASLLVPSFILQPLVENAIKYAVARSRRPVLVKVEGRLDGGDLVLTVSDDGDQPAAASPKNSTGVGLKNVRGRLAAIYGARASLEAVTRAHRGCLAARRRPPRDRLRDCL